MAYFSNSTEGMLLDNQCADCILGESECPIALAQNLFNYDAVNNKVATDILNTIVDNEKGCVLYTKFQKLLKRKAVVYWLSKTKEYPSIERPISIDDIREPEELINYLLRQPWELKDYLTECVYSIPKTKKCLYGFQINRQSNSYVYEIMLLSEDNKWHWLSGKKKELTTKIINMTPAEKEEAIDFLKKGWSRIKKKVNKETII